jgi:hypothetical protein
MHQNNPVSNLLKLFLFFYFFSAFAANGQRKIVKTIAGSTDPIDGPAISTLFGSAWHSYRIMNMEQSGY